MEPAKHILFVEDSTALRDPLTALLELKGYRVGWAADGRQALHYLRNADRPDLILLDLTMPVMDGWQFRREQQHDPALAPIPVVVVSGTQDAARSAADLGAAACLEKPVELDELVAVVREHCGLRHRPVAVPARGQPGRPPALGVGPGKSVRLGVSHAIGRA